MVIQESFSDSFWSSSSSSSNIMPDYTTGIQVLHDKLIHSIHENQAITAYLQKRIDTETEVTELLSSKLEPAIDLALKQMDDTINTSLGSAFDMICQESTETIHCHKLRANLLAQEILEPLLDFTHTFEQQILSDKAALDEQIEEFKHEAQSARMTRSVYWSRCRALESACPRFRPLLGLPYQEIACCLRELNGTQLTSQDIFDCIQKENHDLTHSKSQEICENLVALEFLRPVNGTLYQVQHDVIYRYLDRSNNNSLWTGLFDRFKSSNDTVLRAYTEMVEADNAYKNKTKAVNKMRMKLEEDLLVYLDSMEQLEKERILKVKEAFSNMAVTLSNSVSIFKETYNRMALFQETVKPEQDIRCIVEQFKTGPFCPRPFVYENYYFGSALDQVFGVPIEQITHTHGTTIPPLLTHAFQILEQNFEKDQEHHKDVWFHTKSIKEINLLCEELDRYTEPAQLRKRLESYEITTVANLVRIYLLELPECLLTFDFYEPVKILYSTPQELKSRLASVSKLLATLSQSNYDTLKALSSYLFNILQHRKTDDLLNHLLTLFEHVLLRPQKYSSMNVHDRHPKKLMRDLFSCYNVIFTEETDKAQKYNASRSSIVATPPPPPKDTIHQSFLNLNQHHNLELSKPTSPASLPIVPHGSITLFEDPEYSQASTPTHPTFILSADDDRVDLARLSTDVSLILDSEDSDDTSETRHSVRSRSSTKDTLDNVDLDEICRLNK
ncbi:uncharacterized protein B0P05DRAFT_536212 [Gilbertella persicaria]|uniref:uncharacterized protein n=1 Tax=Gilbertella persicaria TaxID=101096 RepID=UPI00221F1578|nr:uncharacterized protein B0P05DRAFT_536212 [Gilbertella persicaria]KAI8084115.1 hypothetical protein B0P05DRAFT_536212 [Gilbertella persicaria]